MLLRLAVVGVVMRRRRPKTKDQRAHFLIRVMERGCEIPFDEIIEAIRTGKSTPLYRQSHRVTVHRVGDWAIPYDKIRGQPITVMPFDPEQHDPNGVCPTPR